MNSAWVKVNVSKIIGMVKTQSGVFKSRHFNRAWMYLFRTIQFDQITTFDGNQDRLNLFVALHDWLPVQGSAEWLAQRVGRDNDPLNNILTDINGYEQMKPATIGGSELSTIRGENAYQNTRDLVKTKLGMSVFTGSIDTRWGKMMEPVITAYVEAVFDTKIVETGSIPGIRNSYGFPIQSYSPDGLAVVDLQLLRRVLENENIQYTQTQEWKSLYESCSDDVLVLFEFKCPRRRTPKGEVPDHYQSQPRIGQCVINMMKVGVFGDGLFRKCSLRDFGFNHNYDKFFHNSDRYLKVGDPILCGFIGIYDVPEVHMNNDNKNASKLGKPGTVKDSLVKQHIIHTFEDRRRSNKYIRVLYSLVRTEISSRGSDYHHLYQGLFVKRSLSLGHLPTLVGAVCKNVLNIFESIEEPEQELSSRDIEILVWSVVKIIYKTKIDQNNKDLVSSIVKDSILLSNTLTKRYDLTSLNFGMDLGYTCDPDSYGATLEQFENIMEQTADKDAYKPSGYKFYYPENCYYNIFDEPQFSKNNVIDFTVKEPLRSRKWLYNNLTTFQEFCDSNNYRPIGVIPWKLMKVCFTPVWKMANFGKENEATIRSVVNSISSIRSQADESTLINLEKEQLRQQKKIIYKPLVDAMFPKSAFPPPKYPKKKKTQNLQSFNPVEPITTINTQSFDDDDFSQI